MNGKMILNCNAVAYSRACLYVATPKGRGSESMILTKAMNGNEGSGARTGASTSKGGRQGWQDVMVGPERVWSLHCLDWTT